MTEEIRQAIGWLNHPDVAARTAAQDLLLTAGTEGINALLKAVRGPDRGLSLRAAQVLARLEGQARFQAMVELLPSSNPLVGDLAAKTLASYGRLAVGALLAALPYCHALVQLTVVKALERLGDPTVVAPLMEILAATDYKTLRYTIIEALGALGDPAAADLIRSFTDDPDDHLRTRAIIALERLNAPSGEEHG